jgi:outer membrane receptor for ferrienterochelin and colicin
MVKQEKRIDNRSLYAGEYDIYAEDDVRLTNKMKANVGIHFSAFAAKEKVFLSAQPRLNWLYKLHPQWNIKAAASHMNQYIHLLANGNLGLPTDLWLPATQRVPPQSAFQFSAGTTYTPNALYELSVEAYYKPLRNVIEYAEGTGFTNAFDSWEEIVTTGKGKAYGLEWMAQKKKGKLSGLASYTYSRSWRQFEALNNGKRFPYKYDKPHEIKMVAIWQPSKRFECSADWILSSGQAVSIPTSFYIEPSSGQRIDVYETRNNYRMPTYHRLDLSLKFIKQKKKFLRTWVISIYNAYNRQNAFFLEKTFNNNSTEYQKVNIFPILPSVSYQFKF